MNIKSVCIESILQNHYGVKKVILKNDRIAGGYTVASDSEYLVFESLTISGKKAFGKLIGLLRDMEYILGGRYHAAPWVARLKEIASKRWNVYDNAAIEQAVPEKPFTSLECIMRNQFGIKKVFLNRPKHYGQRVGGDIEYDYFTRAGGRVYEQLVKLIYALGELFGSGFDTCFIVGTLDNIVMEI